MRRLGTFFLAAAVLTLETALTRVFALAHGHHFSFLTISVALMGLGAGGTAVTLWSHTGHRSVPRERGALDCVLLGASLAFAITTLGSYVLLNVLPFDVYQIAWDPRQVLYLVLNCLTLTVPFFCSGLVMGLLLEVEPAGNLVYAANLLGSASGCLITLVALPSVGGAGSIALSAAEACIAAGFFAGRPRSARLGRPGAASLSCILAAAAAVTLAWTQPGWFQVQLSPYRPLSHARQFPGAHILLSRWNTFSRVDVVDSAAIHAAPGLSMGYVGPTPPQRGLFVDASSQAAIINQEPASLQAWAEHLPLALAYRLHPSCEVLVLDPGGGLDVAVARSLGAERVTAVSPNALVVEAVQLYGAELYADPLVEVVMQSPRSFVRGQLTSESPRPDVIDLALNDSQQAVVSGGYTLSEDYDYTVQALIDDLALLAADGLLVIHRWLQTPPSESLRAWSLVITALEEGGAAQPQDSLVAIRSWSTMLILAKKGPFTALELDTVRQFCAERQFDLVYTPGIQPHETNRYNSYDGAPYATAFRDLLFSTDREAFYARQTYDVRATTDDRPFFSHFFTWRQLPEMWQAFGHTWQPFGGGGYLILLVLLGLAALALGAAIVLPLPFARQSLVGRAGFLPLHSLAYFGCLGIAYLAVEIPLIQRCVLLVEQPTVAFAVVVSVLLVTSGVGSLLAPRLRSRWLIPVLVLYIVALYVLLPPTLEFLLGRPLTLRIAVLVLLLAPLGVAMGVPFPAGLELLLKQAPGLVPWAWGLNGCTSVIASILSTLVALQWGFGAVFTMAAIAYAMSWVLFLAMRQYATT